MTLFFYFAKKKLQLVFADLSCLNFARQQFLGFQQKKREKLIPLRYKLRKEQFS